METNNNGNKRKKGTGIYFLILLALIAVLSFLLRSPAKETLTYTDIKELFTKGEVTKYVISEDLKMTFETKDGRVHSYNLPSLDKFYDDLGEVIDRQSAAGTLVEDFNITTVSWWVSFVPYIIILVVLGAFWLFMMNRQGDSTRSAMNFGKSRATLVTDANKTVNFNDVAGLDEERHDLQEIVEYLKDPQKFMKLGARIPKGVLLVGPPGTGKTLIARAVAGEAGVPFYSISGSNFVELYVGVGASRVRDLFSQAKRSAPSIVFIDEIDAVGRRRGAGLGGGNDEREQTLNQLLVEMDGFGANSGVIVMAATNRADVLDPALQRPGRFDRQIYIGMPDVKAREAILKVHARKKPLNPDVDLSTVAAVTAGFTGADLENLLNEAALLAAGRNRPDISLQEIDDSFMKVLMGNEKKGRVITDHEKKLTAYHEAGHAVTTRLLPTQDPLHQVSIVPRGMAGGFTMSLPKDERFYMSRQQMQEELITLLGGREAEQLVLGDISTGASNDIQRASDIARKMVTTYGMSDAIGPISYGSDRDEVFLGRDFATAKNFSEGTAALIDQEIKKIIDKAQSECREILSGNRDLLDAVANALLKKETLGESELEEIFTSLRPELPPKVRKQAESPAAPAGEPIPQVEKPAAPKAPSEPEE